MKGQHAVAALLDRHARRDALISQHARIVEFPRILRAGGSLQAAGNFDLVADVHVVDRHGGVNLNPAAGSSPIGVLFKGRHR